MTKRLFLFSIYSRSGVIDDYVLYYLKKLVRCGDVILCADNNDYEDSLNRIQKEISVGIKAMMAFKHGEYDFGSYKYCLKKAEELGISDNYDYVYICNDSVIGPLTELKPLLEQLEEGDTPITTMYKYLHPDFPGPQSWFIGFNKTLQPFLKNFLLSVGKEDHKDDVILKYELGLCKRIQKYESKGLVVSKGLDNFTAPVEFFEQYPNYPFLKKRALCYVGDDNETEDFIRKVIKDPVLSQSIVDLISSIREHEKTLTSKYSGVVITQSSEKKYTLQFIIPPVDPKKKKEQQYF